VEKPIALSGVECGATQVILASITTKGPYHADMGRPLPLMMCWGWTGTGRLAQLLAPYSDAPRVSPLQGVSASAQKPLDAAAADRRSWRSFSHTERLPYCGCRSR